MREPALAAELVAAVRRTVPAQIPVTVKHRAGWDESSLNAAEFARALVGAGAAMITVHGRTRAQGFSGAARMEPIAAVRAALPRHIPVIGNGDVKDVAAHERMKRETGCDAVMIGRGAIANPWIFAGYDREQVPSGLLHETIREHLQKSVQFYGEEDGQRLFRKYAVQYLLLKTLDRDARKEILKERPAGEFLELLNQVYAAMPE
jgi:tRNA-dihydrouridine synthase